MSNHEPSQQTFVVVDSSDVEPRWGVLKPIRRTAGITAFGVNEYHLPPHWDDYDEHDETKTGHVEMYRCISGSGTMTVDGEQVELQPGRYVFVRPECTRNLVAGPEGMNAIVVGAPDVEEFTGWEGL